jgi:hypothetical protein
MEKTILDIFSKENKIKRAQALRLALKLELIVESK